MKQVYGNGKDLYLRKSHPYADQRDFLGQARRKQILRDLNIGRDSRREDAIVVTYYYEVPNKTGLPGEGLTSAARFLLEHGTAKTWEAEARAYDRKPRYYDRNLSWAVDLELLGYNGKVGAESGLIKVAYPLYFFDKRQDGRASISQLFLSIAGEPFAGISWYQGAKIVNIDFPQVFARKFPGQKWPNGRVRSYLGLGKDEPLIGTIVKPKAGLTPGLLSRSVLEVAHAGVQFVKSDENLHLSLKDVSRYVKRVADDLISDGFDLSRSSQPRGKRFLFAPHITVDSDKLLDYAKAAIEAGANALMFSPYFAGGFGMMNEVAEKIDVPIYAHTAGMNMLGGSPTWGIDVRMMYFLAASYGAAFMQVPAVHGYLKPTDIETRAAIALLRKCRLEGEEGMTLAIGGGLGPLNLGQNIQEFGLEGRMILAGSSIYSHPSGPKEGVRALLMAYKAYDEEGIIDRNGLRKYASSAGEKGRPLLECLGNQGEEGTIVAGAKV